MVNAQIISDAARATDYARNGTAELVRTIGDYECMELRARTRPDILVSNRPTNEIRRRSNKMGIFIGNGGGRKDLARNSRYFLNLIPGYQF